MIQSLIDVGIVRWFAKKRISRGIPIIGTVLGGGFSYMFTKEVATYSYMFYRKRFIKEKIALCAK